MLGRLPRVDDAVMDSLLPKKQPAGEIKFKRVREQAAEERETAHRQLERCAGSPRSIVKDV
jgi:hypothetical protein